MYAKETLEDIYLKVPSVPRGGFEKQKLPGRGDLGNDVFCACHA